jgi:hypothetical protein
MELYTGRGAEPYQTDSDSIPTDSQAVDEGVDEPEQVHVVVGADTPGGIHQEVNVGLSTRATH